MRFHVVALPQSNTTRAFSLCGFSQKTIRFCWMMKSLGHTVYLYGGEQNEAPCDEHIVCINEEQRKELCQEGNYIYPSWNPLHRIWITYNARVGAEINKRKQQGDFICILGGNCQSALVGIVPELKVVEYGIGYTGYACKWLVFESHVWRAYCLGKNHSNDMPNPNTEVIPSFYDEESFNWQLPRKDFALFVGRIRAAKGIGLACEACQKAGIPLKVIGFGDGKLVTHGAEYLGPVGLNERNKLMGEARVLLAPTLSFEPFGNVACEAQLCGTPVISTNFGGFVETVMEGVTGYRIGDADHAAKRIGQLDKLARTEVIRARAVSLYSTRNVRRQYQEYFERLGTLQG